jgi:hypothetical protein
MFYHDESPKICSNFMLGFCPDGPNCMNAHVKSSIVPQDLSLSVLANFDRDDDWQDK